MAVLLQATCETNARCANPWPKETFSPGPSESWIIRSSGDIPAPATIRAFSSLSKARRVSFGRPEMNAISSTMKSSEYFIPTNDGVCKKRLRGSSWMIWKKSSGGNLQDVDQRLLDRLRHVGEAALVVSPFEDMNFCDWHLKVSLSWTL